MAASIVSSLIDNILPKLGFVERYLGALPGMMNLQLTLQMIKARLIDAERRAESQDYNLVKELLKNLKHICYRLEDLLEEVEFAVAESGEIPPFSFSPNSGRDPAPKTKRLRSSYSIVCNQLGLEAKDIMEELNHLANLMDALKLKEELPLAVKEEKGVVNNFTDLMDTQHEVIGRDEDKDKIVQMLLGSDEDVYVIPIVGMGGLGKTTLAKLVFNDQIVKNHFEHRYWARVSNICSFQELAGKVLNAITGVDYLRLTLEQIEFQLRQAVHQMTRRYLLVLDDVWEEDRHRWLCLRSLLSGGKPRSKIIVTTRSLIVAQNTTTVEPPYELKGLPEDKSWDLFKRVAFKMGVQEGNRNQANIGKEIVKKCANVPLAIRTIASLLCSMNSEAEWEMIKDKTFAMVEEPIEKNILSTLKLSYDCLPSPLKQCFAYCSVFPKVHVFSKQTLVYLWMAQGFVYPSNGHQNMEAVGHNYFMQLQMRGFFQEVEEVDGDITCTMHDLVHDLAEYVAEGETLSVYVLASRIDDNICHVSFSSKLPLQTQATNQIRSFLVISWSDRLNINALFPHLRFLRVLDLAKATYENLPESIGRLKHLRYLKTGSFIKSLPECITNLQMLQTLDLRQSHCCEFPRDFAKLVNLRHLLFQNFEDYSDMPPGFGQLTSLRTLDAFIVGENNCLDALAGLKHLAGKLTICFRKHCGNVFSKGMEGVLKDKKLTDLSLLWESPAPNEQEEEYELVLRCLQPHPSLRSLSICGWEGVNFALSGRRLDHEFATLLPNLVSIDISNCAKIQILPPLSRLPYLKSIKLGYLDALEYIDVSCDNTSACSTSSGTYFPSLETLFLNSLVELKGWSKADKHAVHSQGLHDEYHPCLLSLPSLPRLSTLCIQKCPKLKSMPSAPKLVSLLKTDCHELTNLTLSSTTSLRKLHIEGFRYLRDIVLAVQHLAILEELELSNCEDLELAGPYLEGPYLEDNTGKDSDNISSSGSNIGGISMSTACVEDIMSNDGDSMSSSNIGGISTSTDWQGLKSLRFLGLIGIRNLDAQQLRDLVCITTLQKLRLMDLSSLRALPESTGHLTQLRHLQIGFCPQLTALPKSLGNLKCLETLWIYACHRLTALPESIRNLTSLQLLQIYQCPPLVKRCSPQGGQYWPLIERIPHVELR